VVLSVYSAGPTNETNHRMANLLVS